MNFKYFLLGIAFALIIVFLSAASFYLGKKSKDNVLKSNPSTETVPTSVVTPSPEPLNSETIKESIVFALKNDNFEILADYMARLVSFRIENSGCCEPQTPVQAVTQLEYLKSAKGSWDFDQESEVVKSLVASYPEHYSDAFIGITSDFYSVAFQFNDQGKIGSISVSSSYKLLLD
jgi:hypothetical protein